MPLREMCERLSPLMALPAKDRFEGDRQYEARVTAEAAKLGVQFQSGNACKVRLSAKRLESWYDANAEQVVIGARIPGLRSFATSMTRRPEHPGTTMFFDPGGPPPPRNLSGQFITEMVHAKITGSERRENAFGTSVEVLLIRGTGVALTVCSDCMISAMGAEAFRMPRPVAQAEFDRMDVVVQGSLVPPALRKGVVYNKPTIQNPRDVVIDLQVLTMTTGSFTFYSPASGEVFHRIGFRTR